MRILEHRLLSQFLSHSMYGNKVTNSIKTYTHTILHKNSSIGKISENYFKKVVKLYKFTLCTMNALSQSGYPLSDKL